MAMARSRIAALTVSLLLFAGRAGAQPGEVMLGAGAPPPIKPTLAGLPTCPSVGLGTRYRVTNQSSKVYRCDPTGWVDEAAAAGADAGDAASYTATTSADWSGWTGGVGTTIRNAIDRIAAWVRILWLRRDLYDATVNLADLRVTLANGTSTTYADACKAMQAAINLYLDHHASGGENAAVTRIRITGSATIDPSNTTRGWRWNGSSRVQDVPYNQCLAIIPVGENAGGSNAFASSGTPPYPVSDGSAFNVGGEGILSLFWDDVRIVYNQSPGGSTNTQARPTSIVQVGDKFLSGSESSGSLDSSGGFITGLQQFGRLSIYLTDPGSAEASPNRRLQRRLDPTHFWAKAEDGTAATDTAIAYLENGNVRGDMTQLTMVLRGEPADRNDEGFLSINPGQATDVGAIYGYDLANTLRFYGTQQRTVGPVYATGANTSITFGDSNRTLRFWTSCHAGWTASALDTCADNLGALAVKQLHFRGGVIEANYLSSFLDFAGGHTNAMYGVNFEPLPPGGWIYHGLALGVATCAGGSNVGYVCAQNSECPSSTCGNGNASGASLNMLWSSVNIRSENNDDAYAAFFVGRYAGDGNEFDGADSQFFTAGSRLGSSNISGTQWAFGHADSFLGDYVPVMVLDQGSLIDNATAALPAYPALVTGTTTWTHATDCTALGASGINRASRAIRGDLCLQLSGNALYACVPTSGAVCDDAGDWVIVRPSDPTPGNRSLPFVMFEDWGLCTQSSFSTMEGDLSWLHANSGTGAGHANSAVMATATGSCRFTTGTTATGRSAVRRLPDSIHIRGGEEFETHLRLEDLSTDSTEEFVVFTGLGDTYTLTPQDAIGIYYDVDAGTTWRGMTCSNSSCTTASLGTTVAADTNYRLGFVVNGAMSSVQFYINGSPAGSAFTTNIPTGSSRATSAQTFILKSAGTTDRYLYQDYFWLMRPTR